MDTPVPKVSTLQEEDRLTCVLDESLFQCPPSYIQIGNGNVHHHLFILFLECFGFAMLFYFDFVAVLGNFLWYFSNIKPFYC